MGNKQSAERKDSKDEGNSHSPDGKDSGLLKDEEQNSTINLLLLGRTGTGKSATGNIILQLEDAFISDDSASSVTTECQAEYSQYQGEDIKVVDMPGLCDASKNREEDLQHIVAKAVDAVAETPDGYDAALIITTYGRQSLDNSTTVEELRDIFGEDVFKEYGILVVTYGDNFKRRKDKNLTFEDYCSKQTGPIKVLYDECHKRAVLFDNVTENPEEIEAQRRKLFDLVKGMSKTKRYTPELFGAAKAKRDELIKKAKHFVLTESMTKNMRLTMHALNKTDIYSEESRETLVEIKDKAAVLIENISSQQEKVERRNDILKFATSLEAAVEKKQNLARVISENRAKKRIRERNLEHKIPENEKETYKKIWERDNKSDEKNIKEMTKLMTETKSQLEEGYQVLRRENSHKQVIIKYLVIGVVCAMAPTAFGVVSLGAAVVSGIGGSAFIALASRGLRRSLQGFSRLAEKFKK